MQYLHQNGVIKDYVKLEDGRFKIRYNDGSDEIEKITSIEPIEDVWKYDGLFLYENTDRNFSDVVKPKIYRIEQNSIAVHTDNILIRIYLLRNISDPYYTQKSVVESSLDTILSKQDEKICMSDKSEEYDLFDCNCLDYIITSKVFGRKSSEEIKNLVKERDEEIQKIEGDIADIRGKINKLQNEVSLKILSISVLHEKYDIDKLCVHDWRIKHIPNEECDCGEIERFVCEICGAIR